MYVVNHTETLELGELRYLAGMVWGRWLAPMKGVLGNTSQGIILPLDTRLRETPGHKRSGSQHGEMGETWCELAQACVAKEASHGDPRIQMAEALHLSHTLSQKVKGQGTVGTSGWSANPSEQTEST